MRALRVVLQMILVPPALAAAAAGALLAVAGQVGRDHADVDLLNHFAILWFAGGGLALVVAVVAQGWLRWTLVAWGLFGALAAALLLAPEFLRDTGPKAPSDAKGQIKVVQINHWIHNKSPDLIWAWLDRIKPDIVVVEETTPRFRAAARARPEWRISCGGCEVMILSRAPPVPPQQERLLGPAPGPITRAVLEDARGRFSVIGVHYAWPTDADSQQAQELGLSQMLARSGDDRTIVAGDFNSAPWSFSRRRWDGRLPVIRRDRAVFTWPARRDGRVGSLGLVPVLPIDHVYAGAGWATVKVERGPPVGSDHYPLVVTLAPVSPS